MQEHEGRRHTVEECRQIIELASRLQDAEADTLSRQELEQAAAELGIKPAFVHQAIAQLESKPESKPPPLVTVFVFGMLVVAQWLAVFTALTGKLTYWNGAHLWLLAALAFAFGLTAVTRRSHSKLTLGVLTSFIVVAVLCAGWVRLTGGEVDSNWPSYLKNLALGQMLLTLLGGLIGRVAKGLIPPPPQVADPTP